MFLRSQQLKQMLIDLYKKLIVKQREHIHLSDLDFPRKSLYDRLYPHEPDEATILRWVRGESSHSFFRSVFRSFPNAEVEQTTSISLPGYPEIRCTPDVALVKMDNWPFDVVFEFKSTIGRRVAGHWIRRLHRYMAAKDANYGVLVVHYLLGSRLECFPVELSDAKLAKLREAVAYFGELFDYGLRTQRNLFPRCPKWLCRSCVHLSRCMRDFSALGASKKAEVEI